MKLAGRCFCGLTDALVAREPDEHMECYGLRWCGVCHEVAKHAGDCLYCARRRSNAAYRRNGPRTSLAARLAQRLASRRWAAKQRRHNSQFYQRQKALKRLRYQTDAAYRKARLEYQRRRHAAKKQGIAA